ncbi:hypothetical protein KKG81_08500 [bacterium]|nr:hypothetical protein [bacterium]
MKKSEKIKYKGKTYYIDSNTDKSNTKLFLYTDPELKKVAKSGSGTLMVKRDDIEDQLKETIKRSELKQLVREEIKNILEESKKEELRLFIIKAKSMSTELCKRLSKYVDK